MTTDETLNELLVRLFKDIMEIEGKCLVTEEFKDLSYNDFHVIEAIGVNEPKTMTTVEPLCGYVTVTFAPAYALPLLVPVFSLVSSGTITCPVIVTVPLSPVAVLSADALILPNGIVVAIINAIINHAAILFPFVLQNISIF